MVTTNIEPANIGKAVYTYVHHEHTEDGITSTVVENDSSYTGSVNRHPEYLKTAKGCYTRAGSISHYHATVQLGGSQGEWKTCPQCGRTLQLNSKGSEAPGTPTIWHAYCSGWAETVYYPACGYDNGDVTDINIHFDKE